MIYKKHTKGFTLVETLVAIAVLSISTMGIFSSVQSSLRNSGFAQDQVTAFFLTQEVIEYIKNIRDENNLYNLNAISNGNNLRHWLYGITDCPVGDPLCTDPPCGPGEVCYIDSLLRNVRTCSGVCPNIRQDIAGANPTRLYGYTSGWVQTNFRRDIQITTINANEVLVAVTIAWNSGPLSRSFVINQMLYNR